MLTNAVIENVSEYVIVQMKRRQLSLTESKRKAVIGIALGSESQGLRYMHEIVEWELTLIADEERRPKIVKISEKELRLGVQAQLQKYLGKIGSEVLRDKLGFYCCIPRSLASTDVAKEIKNILRQCG